MSTDAADDLSWDLSSSDVQLDSTTPKGSAAVAHGTRRLAELLQKHAEAGKAVELTPEDEAKLSEELADWINSDSSPVEPEEDWFERRALEIAAQKGQGDAIKS